MEEKSIRWYHILLSKLIQLSLLGGCLLLLRTYQEGWLIGLLLVPMLFLMAFLISDWETRPRDMLKYGSMAFAILPVAVGVKLLFVSPFLIGFGIAFWIYGEKALGLGTLIGWVIIILGSLAWAGYKKFKKAE